MRRLQIYLDAELDEALGREALRRGTSKAAIIRQAVARDLQPADVDGDPWRALDGWLSDGGVEDIDAAIYGPP